MLHILGLLALISGGCIRKNMCKSFISWSYWEANFEKECPVNCPENCKASGINGTEVCDSTTGECQFGCKDGFYGPACESLCGDAIRNCKRCSVESDTVTCDECMNNFYQTNGKCIVCNYYCKPAYGTVCRESDGYCVYGCREGRYGFTCGSSCSSTCDGACHRETGHCLTGCKFPSYCGPTCQIVCQDGCASQNCNQSCTCTEGCIHTRWGEQCGESCNTNCNEPLDLTSNFCERLTGTCTNGCKNMTHWGNDCNADCSPNCVGGVCQQDNGTCINGCSTDTVHGVGCNIPCGVNCLNGSCERADGTCFGGCKSGYFGNQCTQKCNENCKNKACDRQTGRCLFGCINGYFNDTCNQRCNVVNIVNCVDATCDRKFGNCTCLASYEGDRCERIIETTEVDEGNDVVLQCPLINVQYPRWTGPSGLSNPMTQAQVINEPDFAWENMNDLKLAGAMLKHDGIYTCMDGTGQSGKVDLDVQYFNATSIDITTATPDNDEIFITCEVHSNPPSKILPYVFTYSAAGDNRVPISTFHRCKEDPGYENRMSCRFTATGYVKKQHNGQPQSCVFVYKNAIRAILTKKIVVLFPPTKVDISGNKRITDASNTNLRLNCSTDTSNPAVSSFNWRQGRNTEAKQNNEITSTHPLKIIDGIYNAKNTSQLLDLSVTSAMDGEMVFCCAKYNIQELCTSITLDYDANTNSGNLGAVLNPLVFLCVLIVTKLSMK